MNNKDTEAPERDQLVKKFAYEYVRFNHDPNHCYLVTDVTDDCMLEIEGMSGQFAPSCFNLAPQPKQEPTVGADGRYCTHHDDDPAHTEECYEVDPPAAPTEDKGAKVQNGMSFDGATTIEIERRRQLYEKRYTPGHDDTHTDQSLVKAAVCYATPNRTVAQAVELWPWENPPVVHHNIHNPRGRESRIHELAKAGALIAAEIDRLRRIK